MVFHPSVQGLFSNISESLTRHGQRITLSVQRIRSIRATEPLEIQIIKGVQHCKIMLDIWFWLYGKNICLLQTEHFLDVGFQGYLDAYLESSPISITEFYCEKLDG